MAGIKISALPVVPSVLGTDIYPAVQGGITYQESVNQLTTFMNSNVVLSSTAQVTGLSSTLAGFLPLSGGIMTGNLDMGMHNIVNLKDPVNPQDAATKNYVSTFATGITVILSAAAATTANLNAIYANGAAGVGATLTNNGALAAFAVDGYSASLNDRILVKNQTTTFQNGVYTVTTVGTGAVAWVLTRATDYDQPAEIKPGTLVAINNGTANVNTSWLQTATVTAVGTDPIVYSQFTFAPGAFFLIANNLSEGTPATMRTNLGLTGAATMSLPVSGANGGTGVNNGANTITLGGNVSTAGAFTTSGAFAVTQTYTGATNVTFPTTGTLITSSQPTINQPNIVGTTTNDNAAAGSVGEFISSVILNASSVTLGNGTSKDVTTISLTAGDWDVWGNVSVSASVASIISFFAWSNTSSATIPDAALSSLISSLTNSLGSLSITIPMRRFSLAGTTTLYLSANASFSSGTVKACGGIYARRRR